MKIFVIDDAPIMLAIIEQILKKHVVEGVYIEDVDIELFNKIEEFLPDVIILDLHLKNTDGITVSKDLKARSILKNIPIIAISSDKDLYNKTMKESNNFVDFITKPIIPNELVDKVRQYGYIGKLFNISHALLHGIKINDETSFTLKKL